ncbi:MAG: hypothetical protein JST59_29635 [Actinobacteria bacterium]|nr:hypothetical protein [Actinomycetota bacterium]
MKVHVFIYEHRHGTDVSVHRHRSGGLAAAAAVAREWWEEARRIDPTLPAQPPSDDTEATELYFEAQDGLEFCQIRPCELRGGGWLRRLAACARSPLMILTGRGRRVGAGVGDG